MTPDSDTLKYPPEELCSRIAILTSCIMDFWSDGGWASQEATKLLDESMLRWQVSLAKSLARWIDASSEGDLILAWANLGALVENAARRRESRVGEYVPGTVQFSMSRAC